MPTSASASADVPTTAARSGWRARVQAREDKRPDRRGHEQRNPAIAPLVEQLRREAEAETDGGDRVAEGERIDDDVLRRELPSDRDSQQREHERRGDDDRSPRDRAWLGGEPHDLDAHDDRGRDQELVPGARDGDDPHGHEHDRRERGRLPGHLGVDGLERGGECRAEEPERRDQLGLPADRDHRSDRSDQTRERKRQSVGDEVVARGGRGERRVRPGDARAHRRERRPVLPVARSQQETGSEHRRRGRRSERDARALVDPAAVRGEHEEESDAERHDHSARDREAASAHEVPVARELAEGASRRLRRSLRGRAATLVRRGKAGRGRRRRRRRSRRWSRCLHHGWGWRWRHGTGRRLKCGRRRDDRRLGRRGRRCLHANESTHLRELAREPRELALEPVETCIETVDLRPVTFGHGKPSSRSGEA